MIVLSHAGYQYEGAERPALSGIDLTIPDGALLAVVGHNGSGKSTLAKLLNALLLPGEGKVTVDGMDTCDESCTLTIRQRVGMVFQNPDNQLVTTIVGEDVGFGPENLGVPPAEIRTRVDAALREVGMSAFAEKASHALSGGQKQRIAIAGLLAMQPEMLVLDEATAMLDPQGRQEVLATVLRLNREEGMGVVMITQYMEEAALCDRVLVLERGSVLLDGTPAEVFSQRERLLQCGLDVPEMIRIRDELTAAGLPIAGAPQTAEALSEELCRLLLNA